jgi:hypothetical protein
MKPIKSLLVLAIVCAPVLASAQGYYGRGPGPDPVPGGFHNRTGRLTVGFGIGLGGMGDNGSAITNCDNCDFNPAAFEVDAHIGGVLSPRFALMLELQANGQVIHSDAFNNDTTLTQGAAMVAGQVWLLPVLWLKGGLGFSNLQIDDGVFRSDLGNGIAVMAGIGVELLSARRFALELQGRIIEGTYNGGDDHVTSGTVGFGINWY